MSTILRQTVETQGYEWVNKYVSEGMNEQTQKTMNQ